jgi:hypothetical protein
MTLLVGAAFALILGALGMAGFFMLHGGRDGRSRRGHMVRALAVRIGVSIALFACILLAWRLGWIHPTGLPPGR